jgi:hydroxymethylbilane synthase
VSEALRIGTRRSALALWQAEHVAARIRALDGAPAVELVHIETEGDRIQDVALSQLPGKAFFTKELEEAILDGRVDMAVHSLKDVETAPPAGLELAAVLEREDPRDALAAGPGLTLDSLPEGARIGTSSLRRRAFIGRWRPDLDVVDLRGNVPTRLRRLDDGDYDAIVLAAAGLIRLGRADRITDHFPFEVMLPAVSQGAVTVQIRSGDARVERWVRPLDHPGTRGATAAERALLREVEGGCQVPLGAHATIHADRIRIDAAIASLDGGRAVAGSIDGAVADGVDLGRRLADDLLQRGGRELMDEIRRALGDDGDVGGTDR